MRLIDADSLKDFFFSETSGTEDIINDLMMKHNLDYANDVDEDEVIDFAKDLLLAVRNVIDTEPTIEHDKQIRDEVIDGMTEKYFDAIETILHSQDLKLELNQALSIYSRIMNSCNEIAEKLKEQK